MCQVIDCPGEFEALMAQSRSIITGVLKTSIQNKNIKLPAIQNKLMSHVLDSVQVGEVSDQDLIGVCNPIQALISAITTSTNNSQGVSAGLEVARRNFTDATVGTRHQNS
jgi:hypothetical protein